MSPFFAKSLAITPFVDAVSRNLVAVSDRLGEVQLPPLDTGLTPEAMRALASIYFQSEVEQTGVIVLAETLATNRSSVELHSIEAARKVEEFAQRMRRWPNLAQRQDLYGRLFTRNYEFQRLLANLCLSLMIIAREFDYGRGVRVTDEAQLRQIARVLVSNLGATHTGSAVIGGQVINQQITAAIELLQHPGILAHFAARDIWGVVRATYREQTPDIERFLSRGRAGMRILTWLAGVQFLLAEARPARALITLRDPVLVWASTWLQASGFGV